MSIQASLNESESTWLIQTTINTPHFTIKTTQKLVQFFGWNVLNFSAFFYSFAPVIPHSQVRESFLLSITDSFFAALCNSSSSKLIDCSFSRLEPFVVFHICLLRFECQRKGIEDFVGPGLLGSVHFASHSGFHGRSRMICTQ